ncbi:hypothetical protein ABZ626_03715 [Streptomyces longispororuber]|uniref:hypothetical protein n=1 Tax=Streptomyces longispororuber TaxID=68230 RepID=UPI0033C00293
MQSPDDYKWFIGGSVLITVAAFILGAYIVRKMGLRMPTAVSAGFVALAALVVALPQLVEAMR